MLLLDELTLADDDVLADVAVLLLPEVELDELVLDEYELESVDPDDEVELLLAVLLLDELLLLVESLLEDELLNSSLKSKSPSRTSPPSITWTITAPPVNPIPSIRMNWLACSVVDSSRNTVQNRPISIGSRDPRKCRCRPW